MRDPTRGRAVVGRLNRLKMYMYESSGERLSDPADSGSDPLHGERWEIRDQGFCRRYLSFSSVCHSVVYGDSLPFKQALLFLIDVPTRLSV